MKHLKVCILGREKQFAKKSNVCLLFHLSLLDEHVIPMDPRWNMQCLDIISNSVDFDTEVEHSDQLLILLKSLSNRWV